MKEEVREKKREGGEKGKEQKKGEWVEVEKWQRREREDM